RSGAGQHPRAPDGAGGPGPAPAGRRPRRDSPHEGPRHIPARRINPLLAPPLLPPETRHGAGHRKGQDMWTQEDFPGADKVPWQLLIRARFVKELDALVATTIVNKVAQVASAKVVAQVATAAAEAMRAAPADKLSRTARSEALTAMADFIDICPPWWPWPWPWPGPRPPWWFRDQENPFEQVG